MKVAILGSNGFLGSYFQNNLSDAYNIVPVTRSTCNLENFQEVKSWLEWAKVDIIINCACQGVYTTSEQWISQDVQNNLSIFLNFYNNSQYFDKFINIGSGAEYDRRTSIFQSQEWEIFVKTPIDSYGYSKNIISRICANHEKFFTLRVFGCFDITEPNHRLFKRILSKEKIQLSNRKFDYISAKDLLTIIIHFICKDVKYRDINCVYNEHDVLINIVRKFCRIHKIDTTHILSTDTIGLHYTGDGNKLAQLHLPLQGLDAALEEYRS